MENLYALPRHRAFSMSYISERETVSSLLLIAIISRLGTMWHMELNVTHKEQSDWSATNVALRTKVEYAVDQIIFSAPRAKNSLGTRLTGSDLLFWSVVWSSCKIAIVAHEYKRYRHTRATH